MKKTSVCLGHAAKKYMCQGGKPLKPEPEGLKKLLLPTLSVSRNTERNQETVGEFILWKEKEPKGIQLVRASQR